MSYYGIRIRLEDRNRYFQRVWESVILQIEGEKFSVHVSSGFWRRCPELRHLKIGIWFRKHNLVPWPTYKPPRLILEPTGESEFRLTI
jgi:hypothetical protein